MRLMPVLTDGTNRTTRTPLQLGPHAIPASTMVWVPFGATFGSARSWERPDEYLPARAPRSRSPAVCESRTASGAAGCAQERWDDADAEYEQLPPGRPPAACADGDSSQPGRARRFFPFSLGRRDCVGQSLARMNYLATVATLLSEFRFRLADEARAAPAAPPRLPLGRAPIGRRGADGRPGARARARDLWPSHAAACRRPAHALHAALTATAGQLAAIAGNKDVVCERPGSGPCNMGHPRGQ